MLQVPHQLRYLQGHKSVFNARVSLLPCSGKQQRLSANSPRQSLVYAARMDAILSGAFYSSLAVLLAWKWSLSRHLPPSIYICFERCAASIPKVYAVRERTLPCL